MTGHPLTDMLDGIKRGVRASIPTGELGTYSEAHNEIAPDSAETVVVADPDAPPPKAARKPRATVGKRPARDSSLSDGTCTPKWLADRLPHRDIDPCSNPRSHVKADRCLMLENGDDGLAPDTHWNGSAFVNNPFSKPRPWADKAHAEMIAGRCTDLIVLCKLDTSTAAWGVITASALPTRGIALCLDARREPEIWLFKDRIEYDEHPELVRRRRLERAAAAKSFPESTRARILRGEMTDSEAATLEAIATELDLTGESTANFVSAIVHHRAAHAPILDLWDVANRYVRSNVP